MVITQNLSKEYKYSRASRTLYGMSNDTEDCVIKAVDSVSFSIDKGECISLIGCNGAGKTTLLKLLSGILQSTSGMVRVFGKDPVSKRKENSKRIGTVFGGQTQLIKELPLRHSFELGRSMYQLSDNTYTRKLNLLCEEFDLHRCLNLTVNQLSLGQRMRAEFVYALLPNPELLLLDEPTIALDLTAKVRMYSALKEMNHENQTTVILVTHELADIEKLWPRTMLMDQGKIMFDGEVRRLKAEHGSIMTLMVELYAGLPDLEDLPIIKYSIQDRTMLIEYDGRVISKSTVLTHILEQTAIKDMQTMEPNIEHIVRNIKKKGELNYATYRD